MEEAQLDEHAVDQFTTRWATVADTTALHSLIELAIDTLQTAFLSHEQVKASHAFMGLDTQLVRDGTYLIVERAGKIAGCGGWSRRATLYGGDHTTLTLRDPKLLDPHRDPAKIRAMYTHPDCSRQGVGRLILKTCERAAAAAGYRAVELMATLSGQPLYAACGYEPLEAVDNRVGVVTVPFIRMRKPLQLDLAPRP